MGSPHYRVPVARKLYGIESLHPLKYPATATLPRDTIKGTLWTVLHRVTNDASDDKYLLLRNSTHITIKNNSESFLYPMQIQYALHLLLDFAQNTLQ